MFFKEPSKPHFPNENRSKIIGVDFDLKYSLPIECTTRDERRLISILNPSIYIIDHENAIGMNMVKYI